MREVEIELHIREAHLTELSAVHLVYVRVWRTLRPAVGLQVQREHRPRLLVGQAIRLNGRFGLTVARQRPVVGRPIGGALPGQHGDARLVLA